MEDNKTEKTFSQEDVNRIVQERLAQEKNKKNDELEKRVKELDMRERKMNAIQKLRENGLPDYLVDAINMETDETFNSSMEMIKKMKEESKPEEPRVIGRGDLIGHVGGQLNPTNPIKEAFGLR